MIENEERLPFSLIIVIGIFYWLLAIIWILTYGIIGGFIFKMLSCWQEWLIWVKQDIHEWKRYPHKRYTKYIKYLNDLDMHKKNDIRFSVYYQNPEEELKKIHPKSPFPIFNNFIILPYVTLLYSIPRSIGGMIEGSMIVFADAYDFWVIKILKKDPFYRYKEMLEIERKIESGQCYWDDCKSSFSGF